MFRYSVASFPLELVISRYGHIAYTDMYAYVNKREIRKGSVMRKRIGKRLKLPSHIHLHI